MTLHTTFTTLRAACAFAACLLAAPAVLAQPMPPGGPDPDGVDVEQPDGREKGPRGPLERGVPPFLRGLDLSEAQQDRVFAILHAEAPKQRELDKAERRAGAALRELAHAPAPDQTRAAASAQALGQAIAGQEMLRLQTGAELMAVLTPQQRAQLDGPRNVGRTVGRKAGNRGGQ